MPQERKEFMAKTLELPPLDWLMEQFRYDPESGILRHAFTKSGKAKEGMPVGTPDEKGHLRVVVQYGGRQRTLKVHRVAYAIHHKEQLSTEYEIDHKDLDKSNNRISNLRKATRLQNSVNTKNRREGRKRCVYLRTDLRTPKWQARIKVGKKQTSLGCFGSEEQAYEAYSAAARELHGEYFNG